MTLVEELCQRFSGVFAQPVIYVAMPLVQQRLLLFPRLADILNRFNLLKSWPWVTLPTTQMLGVCWAGGSPWGNASCTMSNSLRMLQQPATKKRAARAIENIFCKQIKQPAAHSASCFLFLE